MQLRPPLRTAKLQTGEYEKFQDDENTDLQNTRRTKKTCSSAT
jgi:hypothetical protein